MKTLLAAAALSLIAGAAFARSQEITRAGSQAASVGPAETFTGTALIEPVFGLDGDRDFSMGEVTFLPSARSHWHSHPRGQTLVVTGGTGWTQAEGGTRSTINAGDMVWCPPGVRHWHGATDTTAISHLAIDTAENGEVAAWMEPVTDAQYGG